MDEAALVKMLYEARRMPRELNLPRDQFDLKTALRLQLAVADRFAAEGELVGGWKVGMTSGGARDMMGKNFRPHGYVLASRIYRSGDAVPFGQLLNCWIEPEICLIVGVPLQGQVTPVQARAAVRAVAPAFELNEIRVPGGRDADHATLIADGLANWGLVVGAEMPLDVLQTIPTMALFCDGEELTRTTAGVPLDDPFVSLSRLVTSLGEAGRGLEAGQPVLTGSFAHERVERPSVWQADFGPLGGVSITFT